MWITRSTALITPVCIEIEKPGKRWFTKGGHPTAELSQALDQLIDWKVWFSESENQSIFRKTYLRGQYEDRQLLPQYVLIYGRASEFEVPGPHERPDRLRKKRDFMRRGDDEHFMTFDSLRPKRDSSDFATLSMTANGPKLHAVPLALPPVRQRLRLRATSGSTCVPLSIELKCGTTRGKRMYWSAGSTGGKSQTRPAGTTFTLWRWENKRRYCSQYDIMNPRRPMTCDADLAFSSGVIRQP